VCTFLAAFSSFNFKMRPITIAQRPITIAQRPITIAQRPITTDLRSARIDDEARESALNLPYRMEYIV
jgi:hypothetical protein